MLMLIVSFSAWEVNTALQKLDIDAVKKEVKTGNTMKKKKALWEAFVIASEEHDLEWFKDMLQGHEEAMQVDLEEQEVKEAVKKEKKEKKARKSTAPVESGDDEMGDVDDEGKTPAKKAKQSKKRKKEDDSEGESEKVCPYFLLSSILTNVLPACEDTQAEA